MKRITVKSFVKVIKCSENHHNGHTGHVVSKRITEGYNLRLTNHENCFAEEVELLVLHKTPKKKEVEPINWWAWWPFA